MNRFGTRAAAEREVNKDLRRFERRGNFGLRGDVHFVCQGTLPALTPDGQLLLAAPDRLFLDGHPSVHCI